MDGHATLGGLQTAVEDWAGNPTEPDAPVEEVLIYLTGHGGDGVFELSESESVSAAELDVWLDGLQAAVTGQIVIIYDACMSGSFLPSLTPPAGYESRRIVLTGASAEEKAWFVNDGIISFSYRFWSSVRDTGRLFRSYLDGKEMIRIDQTARIDLNGDGGPDEVVPEDLAEDLVIGRGRVAASSPPQLGAVSVDAAVLGCETESTLLARDIRARNGLESVWARIVPPEKAEPPTEPLLTLPTVKLTDPDVDGIYEGLYAGFMENGVYLLVIYTVDKSGYHSIPRSLTVTRSCGAGGIEGDLDGNGSVDLEDAVIGLRVLAGVDVSHLLRKDFPFSGADCDLDGRAGLAEVIIAMRKAAEQ